MTIAHIFCTLSLYQIPSRLIHYIHQIFLDTIQEIPRLAGSGLSSNGGFSGRGSSSCSGLGSLSGRYRHFGRSARSGRGGSSGRNDHGGRCASDGVESFIDDNNHSDIQVVHPHIRTNEQRVEPGFQARFFNDIFS